MKQIKVIFFGFLLMMIFVFPQVKNVLVAQSNNGQKLAKANVMLTHNQRDGQKVFEQNCSRCHNAPESFSPHISGTIVRHMRIRAGLSKEDEQALLRFLNP